MNTPILEVSDIQNIMETKETLPKLLIVFPCLLEKGNLSVSWARPALVRQHC